MNENPARLLAVQQLQVQFGKRWHRWSTPQTKFIIKDTAFEYSTEAKHEYEKGKILMMTGETINHGILCGNVYNELRRGIEKDGSSYRVIGS